MATDAISTEELIEVAETVTPGDEVTLETSSQEYKNPIPVVGCVVTEWISPGENWRTARVDLQTELGTNHEIVGVEGGRDPRDYTSGHWYYVRRLEAVEPDDGGDQAEGEDLDPIQALAVKRKVEGMTHYSNIDHLTLDEVLDAVESAQTIFEVQDALRINRQTAGWVLKELGLRESFKQNNINGKPRADLIEIVRKNLNTDAPDGDDSWQEMYDRAGVS